MKSIKRTKPTPMQFQPFAMERYMSVYEMAVDYNLSESGVHPLKLQELLELGNMPMEELLQTEINYAHANGIPSLRENIAHWYQGATPANVLVTVGAIEANFNTLQTLTVPGDEVVVMLPNYMQVWGVAQNYGLKVKTFSLREEQNWSPDLAELEEQVTPDTKLISICNPNNPTGYILTETEMDFIVRVAEKAGAWILADEVYAGAEQFTDTITPSFYGKYDRVISVGSMSKAYGLPGLRTGWLVAPPSIVDQVWARHEYTTLSATMLSNKLASLALSEKVQPLLLQRTRKYIRNGYPVLVDWMEGQGGIFSAQPPSAAAIAFVKYNLPINSTELAMQLMNQKSVLIIPGDHFGMDRYLRISFGLPQDYLTEALKRIQDHITSLEL